MTCVPHGATDCHVCGVARVRSALARAPRPTTQRTPDPDPARDLALVRARADREARKESKQ